MPWLRRAPRPWTCTSAISVIRSRSPDWLTSASTCSSSVRPTRPRRWLASLLPPAHRALLRTAGTEKYPDEAEYNQYLNQHGGMSNAYTSMENTNYYFDVQQEHFPGALDRFAQFFIKPLFTKDATDRELNAIESENSKNLQNDMWRSFQLEKSLSSPERASMPAAASCFAPPLV